MHTSHTVLVVKTIKNFLPFLHGQNWPILFMINFTITAFEIARTKGEVKIMLSSAHEMFLFSELVFRILPSSEV